MICTKTLPKIVLNIEAEDIGDDLLVILTGGKAHIGAVSLATYDKDSEKAVVSSMSIPGHKEEEIAANGASYLSEKLKRNVLMSVGIHVDNPTERDLEDILRGCKDIIIVFGHNYE